MKKILFLLFVFVFCTAKQPLDLDIKAVLLLTQNGSKLACLDDNGNLKLYASKDIYFINESIFRGFKIIEHKEEFKKNNYIFKVRLQDLNLVDMSQKDKENVQNIYKSPYEDVINAVKEIMKNPQSPIKDLDENYVISIKILDDKFISFSVEEGGYSGGVHPSAFLNYYSYDIDKKTYITFKDLLKINPDIQERILERIQSIVKSNESEIIYDSVPKKTADRIKEILLSSGYEYDPEHFYPEIKDGKEGVVFCFPHANEVNRGTNYKVFVPLTKKVEAFKNYYNKNLIYSKLTKGKEITSCDYKWSISLDKNMNLFVNKKLFIEKLTDENQFIDFFWIYEWPKSKGDILGKFYLKSDYQKTYK